MENGNGASSHKPVKMLKVIVYTTGQETANEVSSTKYWSYGPNTLREGESYGGSQTFYVRRIKENSLLLYCLGKDFEVSIGGGPVSVVDVQNAPYMAYFAVHMTFEYVLV